MRYLILGSDGQIGGHLQEYLRSKGHTVTEFDIELSKDQDLRKQNRPFSRFSSAKSFAFKVFLSKISYFHDFYEST